MPLLGIVQLHNKMSKQPLLEKAVDDSTKFVITSKFIKWVFGLLSAGIIGILGFAWGLYINVKSDIKDINTNIKGVEKSITKTKEELSDKIEALEDGNVRENSMEISKHEGFFLNLFNRVDTRDETINRNSSRPSNLNSLPE